MTQKNKELFFLNILELNSKSCYQIASIFGHVHDYIVFLVHMCLNCDEMIIR